MAARSVSAKSVSALRAKMIEDLQLAGLSERTQEAYVRSVRKLTQHYGQSPQTLSEQQLRDYFLFLKNERRLTALPAGSTAAARGLRRWRRRSPVPR